MDTLDVRYVLLMIARLLEMFGFLLVLFMVFKGIAIRFILSVTGTTITAMTTSIYGFFTGKIPVSVSFTIDIIGAILALFITYYGFVYMKRSKLKPPPIPKDNRCPVCGAFVKHTHDYLVAREGKDLFYFDSQDHFRSFIENFEEYKSLRKLNMIRVEDVYEKASNRWYSLDEFTQLRETPSS